MNDARILYIEDEVGLGRITSDVLIKNGFTVTWIQDGIKGLKMFTNGQFDLCIVDIMLPGMDGYTLVDRLRKLDEDIPVIFLSARSLPGDVIRGFETGGNDYLRKPFSIEELIIRMQALLKRRIIKINTEQPQAALTIGIYSFDRVSMTLSTQDGNVKLTYLESELLYHLIVRKNDVLDRQQVLLELWGNDSFFNARSMDVFVSKLRKYLSDDHRISIINLRGKGFKLVYTE